MSLPVGHERAAVSPRHVRVGVIGYGYWGPKHVRVLRGIPGVSVHVADHDPARRALAVRAFPELPVHSSIDALLAEVDAVVIALPVSLHHPAGLAALQAGKHVLVEKPLALTVSDSEALIEAAAEAKRTLMVGHTFEYNAGMWRLRELIDSGALGDLCYIDAARLNLGLYRSDINVVWDLAPHDVSILNYLLGKTPESVAAWGRANGPSAHEDVAYLCLQYADPDVSAYVRVSWLDPCKVRRVTVVGRDKMVVCNDLSASERVRIYDVGVQHPSSEAPEAMPMVYHHGDIVTPFVPFEEPLAVQDEHFIECIRTGARPRTDGASGLEVVRVLEAASESLKLQRPVHIRSMRPVRRIA